MKNKNFRNVPKWIWIVLILFGTLIFISISDINATLIIINKILQSKMILNFVFTFTALTFLVDFWLDFNNDEKSRGKDIAWMFIDYITYAASFYTFYHLFYGLYYQLTSETGFVFVNSKEFDLTLFLVFLVHAFFRPFPRLIGIWIKFFEFYSSEDVQVEI